MAQVVQKSDGSKANIVVIPSAPKLYMSGKIPYVFRQDSDFFYLTGCLEPDVALVITSTPGSDNFQTILFVPPTDSHVSRFGLNLHNSKLTSVCQSNLLDRSLGRP